MVDTDFLHNAVNSVFTGNLHMFRLFQNQCLIHTDPVIGVITFILLEDLFHGIHQRLIFPWTVFVFEVLVKSVSADMTASAVKGDFSFYCRSRFSFLKQ